MVFFMKSLNKLFVTVCICAFLFLIINFCELKKNNNFDKYILFFYSIQILARSGCVSEFLKKKKQTLTLSKDKQNVKLIWFFIRIFCASAISKERVIDDGETRRWCVGLLRCG